LGGACSTRGRNEKCMQGFGRKTTRKVILECVRDVVWETVDWMHQVQGRDQWRAALNTEMDLQYSKLTGCNMVDQVSILGRERDFYLLYIV